jgi:hypothetical protein
MAGFQKLTFVSCCDNEELNIEFNLGTPGTYVNGSTYYYNGNCFTAFISTVSFPTPPLPPPAPSYGGPIPQDPYLEDTAYLIEDGHCDNEICPDCDHLDCYYVENCFDPSIHFYAIISNPDQIGLGNTYSLDLSNVQDLPIDFNDCWNITSSELCDRTFPLIEITAVYESCEDCSILEVPPCFLLIDCYTGESLVYSGDVLNQYINTVIQVNIEGVIRCFKVQTAPCTEESLELVFNHVILECFDITECLLCLPKCICTRVKNKSLLPRKLIYIDCNAEQQETVEIVGPGKLSKKYCVQNWISTDIEVINFGDCVDNTCPEVPQPARKVKPGYDSPVCSPEKYEKIVCKYAELMYKHVLQSRYGISDCCDEDDIVKREIEFDLLMLDVLNDTDYECTETTSNCGSCGYISTTVYYTECPEPRVYQYRLSIGATPNSSDGALITYIDENGLLQSYTVVSINEDSEIIFCAEYGSIEFNSIGYYANNEPCPTIPCVSYPDLILERIGDCPA